MLNLYQIRKELHKIPERGFEEFKTTEFLKSILSGYANIKILTFDFTGFIVEYASGKGSYKLFRADMDALPIPENENCPFRSRHEGMMHACGHDLHMTILLGLIDKVVSENLNENLLFVFQPAEEGQGGAERILKTGILEGYNISSAYALHVNGHLPLGTIASKGGVFFANTQEITVRFRGRSAHVAFPQNGRNALAGGADFYLNLKSRILKEFSGQPRAICEFGRMQAGTVMNAVAADCVLEGTMRAFEQEDWGILKEIVNGTARESSEKFGLKYEIIYKSFYQRVVNDSDLCRELKLISQSLNIDFQEAEAVFTGEDFGYFAARYPSLLFWLGVHSGKIMDLHSSDFLPDERAIDIGVEVFYHLIKSKKTGH